ncbi:hypothetical protein C4D60_Mb02t15000 [Musa balbisiana]|uniref:Uncharacterized protein n=1 Tax=Musa balbisiana TaxID=52838 RepID=A0A4S8IAU1_MUSBA|nr:hypothetical protein C4D60_Mb02t15000 [Musa balbisiana]
MTAEEGDKSFLERMLSHLRSTSKYYTGYPKDLGPSRIVHFTSERHFVQLLHEGSPAAGQGKVVDPNITKYSVKVLPFLPSNVASESSHQGFGTIVYHLVDPVCTSLSQFNYDVSVYGFREFFKRHGMNLPETK